MKEIKWYATGKLDTKKCPKKNTKCKREKCKHFVLDEDEGGFGHPGISLWYCKLEN